MPPLSQARVALFCIHPGRHLEAADIYFATFVDSANRAPCRGRQPSTESRKKKRCKNRWSPLMHLHSRKRTRPSFCFSTTSDVLNKVGLYHKDASSPLGRRMRQGHLVLRILSRCACMFKIRPQSQIWCYHGEAARAQCRSPWGVLFVQVGMHRCGTDNVVWRCLERHSASQAWKKRPIYWVTIAACGALMQTLWGFACRRLRVCKFFSSNVF